MEKESRLWGFIVENNIATEAELQLVTDINGYSVDTLGDVIYARTAYRSVEQLSDEYDTTSINDIEW